MYESIERCVLKMVRDSTPEQTVWNMEKARQGKDASWNYIDGCMLTALLNMAELTGDRVYYDFVESVVDHFVDEDGGIKTLEADKCRLDDINEGRVLFAVYKRTQNPKYRRAIETLKKLIDNQPRTESGNFWHKLIYPNQVWLDGVYMAMPFMALYTANFGGDYSDILHQIRHIHAVMRSPKCGLYYHGYDESRRAFWADKSSGLSRSFWVRAIGWYAVALADMIEILPRGDARDELIGTFSELMDDLSVYADKNTGMYYQVVDQTGREGNYPESSGSSMIAYAMLKGARLGVIPHRYSELGQKTFAGIVNTYLRIEGEQMTLGGICLSAGLGPEENRKRDGSFEYYVSEPIVENDAKGLVPFLLAYTEIKRLAYLSLINVNKIYPNGFHAVHNFSMDIRKGEFVVFVGPSGCGKSTTLRMIAGLEDISSGELLIEGKRANEKSPRQRGIAMVFQSYALYPQMTVYDNIGFGLNLQGVDESEIEQRVNNVAKILGLTEYLDRLPRALSGGQRQRVAIGRAIIRKVGVFLMDEPLSNLDAKQRVTMRYEIAQIHKETGATTIYVTHDQTEAMTLADRIVVMKEGYVQQIGTPHDLYFHPENVFVASFIGEPPMNFIRQDVKDGCVRFGDIALPLNKKLKEVRAFEGNPIVFGYRPESISLVPLENAYKITCNVELTEMLGDYTNVYINAGEDRAILKVDSHDTPETDRDITFWIPYESVYLFDGKTERIL